jgi:hypothetical protein
MMIFQLHDKHGRHIAYDETEAANNRKNGWRDVTRKEFYCEEEPVKPVSDQVSELVDDIEERYEKKFGKRPHHRMKRENIEAALHDDGT